MVVPVYFIMTTLLYLNLILSIFKLITHTTIYAQYIYLKQNNTSKYDSNNIMV